VSTNLRNLEVRLKGDLNIPELSDTVMKGKIELDIRDYLKKHCLSPRRMSAKNMKSFKIRIPYSLQDLEGQSTAVC
jgi:hypothetical protein